MQEGIGNMDEWWRQMPGDWTEIESDITLEEAKKLLWRFQTDPAIFWEVQ